MIILKDLSKYYPTKYGAKYVFRDLNLILPSDRDVGILGGNGSGKTTLLNILSRVDLPTDGEVITDRIVSWPLGVSSGLTTSATGRENVRFVHHLYGMRSHPNIEDYVQDFSELGRSFDMPISSYSSGMRVRYNFALSMGFDFDTYLVDEAMAVGDRSFKRKCEEAFDAKRKIANIILVTHQMENIRRNCNAVVVLANGRADFYEDIERGIWRYERI